MPKDAPLPPLAELLKKSRELRERLGVHAERVTKLRASVERASKRTTSHSRFSPE